MPPRRGRRRQRVASVYRDRVSAVAGPTCPVETVPPDPACAPRPVAGAVVDIKDAAGARIASVTLDAAGLGFAEVPPGGYLVVARSAEG